MSCLFDSLAFHISNIDGATLRQYICDYLEKNPSLYATSTDTTTPCLRLSDVLGTEQMTLSQYINMMRMPQTWGGGIEIRAFCDIFNVNVHVFMNHHNSVVFSPCSNSSSELPILCIRYTGNHYEPVLNPTTTNQIS